VSIPYKPLDLSLNIRLGEAPDTQSNPHRLRSSEEVYDLTKDYAKADREVMLVVMVDCKNDLIHLETHTIGSVDSAMVYPREIFRSLLLKNATAFMLVHNHPSGDPEPSLADRELTRELNEGAKVLGIKMLDHVVLGDGRYVSLADQGEIDR
jgi:DNA repair protein RadC